MTVDLLSGRINAPLRKPLFRPYLVGSARVGIETLHLVKPLTYMNGSGEVVSGLLRRYRVPPDRLLVICDNLDLPPGVCRLKLGGSSAGHRGLASIIEHLGNDRFARLYIGIGRPKDGEIIAHVLGDPTPEEEALYASAVDRAAQSVVQLLSSTPQKVMNELNERGSRAPQEG